MSHLGLLRLSEFITAIQKIARSVALPLGPTPCGRIASAGHHPPGCTVPGPHDASLRQFGISLPHDEAKKQYRYGSRTREPEAGDLVCFDERGRGTSHVGIATGEGTNIHSSDHWNKVTETEIEHIKGHEGTRWLL